jgi:hypothetical protein
MMLKLRLIKDVVNFGILQVLVLCFVSYFTSHCILKVGSFFYDPILKRTGKVYSNFGYISALNENIKLLEVYRLPCYPLFTQ